MIRPLVDLGYPTEAHGRIPAFNSVEEEAEFWDTHAFTDYLDESQPVEPRVSPTMTSEYRLVVALDGDDWRRWSGTRGSRALSLPSLLRHG